MPISELITLALFVFGGICVTHPMNAALAIRRVEASMLREASDTRSWGYPVIFPSPRRFDPSSLGMTPRIYYRYRPHPESTSRAFRSTPARADVHSASALLRAAGKKRASGLDTLPFAID
jgi:hypothetical protein